MSEPRRILIIEDDPAMNDNNKLLCRIALSDIRQDGLSVEAEYYQAYDLTEAMAVLDSDISIDVALVDLALGKAEEKLTRNDRNTQGDPGGIQLLQDFSKRKEQTIVIVISGEKDQDYANAAWNRYGALAFYQKDNTTPEMIQSAIKAAFWYLNAVSLLSVDVERALKSWEQAVACADQAVISPRSFPHAFKVRLDSLGTHAITGLPSGPIMANKLRQRILGGNGWEDVPQTKTWTIIRLAIEGFHNFIEEMASQEEPLLRYVVQLAKNLEAQLGDTDFIGHLGNSMGPILILVFNRRLDHDTVENATGKIRSQFLENALAFQSDPAIAQLMGKKNIPLDLNITIWNSEEHVFSDYNELIDTLGGQTSRPS